MEKAVALSNLSKVIDPTLELETKLKYLNLSVQEEDVFEIMGMILKNRKTTDNEFGFNSPCFKKHIEDEKNYLRFLQSSDDIEEGLFQCGKCKSKKIFTTSKQTNRCDEATKVFACCSQCKNSWVM